MVDFFSRYAPGYEGKYIVYTDGRIYSIPRRGTKGGYLKQSPDGEGYLRVTLTNKDGTQSTKRVHNLVMLTFKGSTPKGLQVCHNDGDQTNNSLNNLRYDTPSANNLDKRAHGTSNAGARNPKAKLTEAQVAIIRLTYSLGGYSYSQLASEYGVDKTTIGRVVSGKSWTATMKRAKGK